MTVGVVGLGVSGLRCAMLLEAAGAQVELFEARDRLGGRLFTPDRGDGAVYDAGGEWIDSDHERVLGLCATLGVATEPSGFWPGRVVYGGRHSTEDLLWADALEDDLRVEAAARELCRNLTSPPWMNVRHSNLDRRNLDSFLREHCTSQRGLWWLTARNRSDEGEDPEHIGLLGWLCGHLHHLDRDPTAMSAFRIAEGGQVLCERMAERLTAEPRLGCALRHVRQHGRGVRLEFDGFAAEVDRVVLTLPPPALERVVFDPPMAVAKRCSLEACGMSRAIKIAWQFERPWWVDSGWNGRMLCEGPVQQTWDGSRGGAPVLCASVGGEDAARLLRSGDPVGESLRELALIDRAASDGFVRGWVHDWVGDPLAGGAFSHVPPAYVLEFMEHIATPEGRIHFAGEHTALWSGFVEGAIESAERAAEEVIDAQSAG